MRKSLITVAALAVLLIAPVSVSAQEAMTKGEITKVDADQGKLTIKHEPIKKYDMDAMTMIFKAGDPAMIAAVKPGDKVQFNLDKINGQFTVTKIEKAK